MHKNTHYSATINQRFEYSLKPLLYFLASYVEIEQLLTLRLTSYIVNQRNAPQRV